MTNKWTGYQYQCTILNFESMTLTFELGTRVLRLTLPLTVLYICAKLFQNPSINDTHMGQT